jgi:putative ABC transport system permease protein
MRHHPAFAAINIVGLSVSMAVGLVLILFLRQAASQDEFHENSDRLVRIYSDFKSSSNRDNALYGTSPANLSDLLVREIPGVEQTAKVRSGFRGTLEYDGVGLPMNGIYADPAFFDLFSFELATGDPATALADPGSLVLSPREAVKFFGTEDPLGKVMRMDDDRLYTVTGILARGDYPTVIPVNALASYSTLESQAGTRDMLENWTRSIYGSYTFALLEKGVSISEVQARVDGLIPVHFAARNNNRLVSLIVQPVPDINLGVAMGNELGATLPGAAAWFLGALGLMILLTACFNYVGLTVSRAMKRSREVGVRKVFGAARSHITLQFIIEAVAISSLSVIAAVGLLQWMVPSFNSMSFVSQTGMTLLVDYSSDLGLYAVILIFTLTVGLIAGLYPALFLSRFQPAEAVKGMTDRSGKGGSLLRKSLVVIQFSLSLIFVIVTLTMSRQASYMQKADYGFAQSNIINVRLFDVPFERFRDGLASSASVERVSGISNLPALGSRSDRWLSNQGMAVEDRVKGYQFSIDENLVETLELDIVAGTDLTPEMDFSTSGRVLVNEKLLKALSLGDAVDAIGESFIIGDSTVVSIAGVLRDFNTDPLTESISPNLFVYDTGSISWANVRLVPGRLEEGVADIEAAWIAMGHPRQVDHALFEVQLKDNFVNLLVRDMYRLIGFIAMLTVIIACLGLLGIASFNVERRTREISIRKVLGAEVSGLVRMLSREFLVLIGIAAVVSIPIAWVASTFFLQAFEYRVNMGIGTVALGLFAILVTTLSIIGSQTVKAALSNPVDNLHEN